MGIFNFKPDPLIGIDISSTAVKLLELSSLKGGQRFRVENYAIEPLPEKAVEDKNIVDLEVVGEAIRRALKRAKPRAKFAAVAVSGPTVMTKIINMTAGMSDSDLLEAIKLDAEQYIPFPIDEVNLDFEIIGPSEREPETRVDVLLVASRNETVDSRVSVIELAGLETKVVDIEKYALENALRLVIENDPEIQADETIALLEVGATTTSMNVMNKRKIIYNREEMFGGKRLTESIQSRYGLSYEEANLAKRNGGLPDDYEIELLEPFKQEVALQINRMINNYYSAAAHDIAALSHILIAGGCASIPGLREHISERVGSHVAIANLTVAMDVDPRVSKKALMNDAPALMIACGLALRSFDNRH